MKVDINKLDDFTRQYIESALWAETDESTPAGGEPIDRNYSIDDIDPESLSVMVADCKAFQEQNAALLKEAYGLYKINDGTSPESWAGHDFWMSRRHHGCGFWDRDLGEVGDKLTKAADAFKDCHLYIFEGKVFFERG